MTSAEVLTEDWDGLEVRKMVIGRAGGISVQEMAARAWRAHELTQAAVHVGIANDVRLELQPAYIEYPES